MDEMKVKLSTKFMRSLVSKLIARTIYKKYGYKIDIQLNDLDISVINGEAKVSTNVEVKLDSQELTKILNGIGLD